MAIDLFCYSSLPLLEVQKVLSTFHIQHPELFSGHFLISEVSQLTEVEKEIALGHGLLAQCLFLIRVNNKSELGLMPTVIDIVKNTLNNSNVVILFENEERR
ncbi:MAG: hypothetical protein HY253_09520 [Burkholderiales bacterium]|nr:hypothetical protein [Burkholderiales bacterium]